MLVLVMPIIVSNISDTGLTLNLSGQSTGAFDVGFATGTISGSGSSLTVGFNRCWFHWAQTSRLQLI